jgi:outer membrane protein assembly factor BamD
LRRIPLLLMCAVLLASASQCSAQILHKKKKPNKSTEASNTAEPDKQLYNKAMDDIKRGKQEVGRLSLQTLINTYPDSEYLAKAKLAIADSYFKEGGTSNVTQAVAGYKDFIVFFPFMPEAAYAQMQVAMAHYNEMPKADRDNDHARLAEEEFQTFLQRYPKDPLVPQAQQHLREVQEILAEGQFRIAYYYYVKGDRRAAAGRLSPLTRRYPLYSKSDTALWMLADLFEKSERKDLAGVYYGQIVRNYPLSKHAADAKGKLKSFGMPIPQPDPRAVTWMTAEQNAPRPRVSMMHKSMGIFHSGPDVRMTAISGTPQMEPESSDLPGTDILTGGSSMRGTGAGKSGIVATVATGETTTSGTPPEGAATEDVNPAPGSDSTNGTTPDAAAPATGDGTAANPPATDAATSDPAKTDGTAPSTNTAATDSAKTDGTPPAADSQNQKESSSKKKGLRKLIPW